jgi:excisionase family DNA binding protein
MAQVAKESRIIGLCCRKKDAMLPPQPDDNDDPVLTTAAAARLLGVAVSTAQLWMESGALPVWKTPGGHRRVRLSAVTRLLEQRNGSVAQAAPAGQLPPEFLPVPDPAYPVPPNEAARLAALHATGLVDTPPEDVFDRLTRLAAQVTDCPMALITLLTSERQWFKARTGLSTPETARESAFCSHAILQAGPFMVEDARRDPRFEANPLVTGEPHIRFYGAFPLLNADGLPLGALCVLDREPRRLRDKEIKALGELAAIASDEIKRRG